MNRTCECGNQLALKGIAYNGKPMYRSCCNTCRRLGRREKKDHCERCGFIPEDKVQLDIDHIDGNRSNNAKKNLQTLCANCHRLKTKQNRDYRGRYEKM